MIRESSEVEEWRWVGGEGEVAVGEVAVYFTGQTMVEVSVGFPKKVVSSTGTVSSGIGTALTVRVTSPLQYLKNSSPFRSTTRGRVSVSVSPAAPARGKDAINTGRARDGGARPETQWTSTQ